VTIIAGDQDLIVLFEGTNVRENRWAYTPIVKVSSHDSVAENPKLRGFLVPGDDPWSGWIEHLPVDDLGRLDLRINSGILNLDSDGEGAACVGFGWIQSDWPWPQSARCWHFSSFRYHVTRP
jgi:hypothetical protein